MYKINFRILILLVLLTILILLINKQIYKDNFNINCNLNKIDNIKNRNIFLFWTGDNKMSEDRKKCLNSIKDNTECNVILITNKNLQNYILKENPLHPAYKYLSFTHKADYLRTYFMNFYGGGYSDIKYTDKSWKKSFEKLNNNDKTWAIGYPEIKGGVAYGPLSEEWNSLIGNGAYIFKSNTKYTNEWYNEMIKLLDEKYEDLKKNPANNPQDAKENNTGYPIEWNEMLGRIFHKVNYKYKEKVIRCLPAPNFTNYR